MNLLTTLNSITPMGIIALLGYVIYLLVKNKKNSKDQFSAITENHLHELPTILETLQRMEISQSVAFATIIAKLNGGPKS